MCVCESERRDDCWHAGLSCPVGRLSGHISEEAVEEWRSGRTEVKVKEGWRNNELAVKPFRAMSSSLSLPPVTWTSGAQSGRRGEEKRRNSN